MTFEGENNYRIAASKLGDDTALHGCPVPKQKSRIALSKNEPATRISEQEERHARASSAAVSVCVWTLARSNVIS